VWTKAEKKNKQKKAQATTLRSITLPTIFAASKILATDAQSEVRQVCVKHELQGNAWLTVLQDHRRTCTICRSACAQD
jgi:hypothetical protein